MTLCILTTEVIYPEVLEAQLSDPACGGVVTFVGKVRNHQDGKQVTGLSYSAYAPMVLKVFDEIIKESIHQFSVKDARIVHRVGELDIGEVAVWVGVESGHRKECFEACHYIIDELKKRAPIWKKEHYAGAPSAWVACHCTT